MRKYSQLFSYLEHKDPLSKQFVHVFDNSKLPVFTKEI